MIDLSFLAFAVGFLVVLPLAAYLYERRPSRRAKLIARLLVSAGVDVDEETRASLDHYAMRRLRWGILGAEVGMALVFPLGFAVRFLGWSHLTGLVFPLLTTMGQALGYAISGLTTTELADDEPRLATLGGHHLADYLQRRKIVAEVLCGAAGVVTSLAAVLALVLGSSNAAAWVRALVLGAVATAATLLALALQKRLLEAPVRATSPTQLVAQDLVLASCLNDLFRAVVATTVLAIYWCLMWTDSGFGIALLLMAAYLIVMRWFFDDEEVPPARLPLARHLTEVKPV